MKNKIPYMVGYWEDLPQLVSVAFFGSLQICSVLYLLITKKGKTSKRSIKFFSISQALSLNKACKPTLPLKLKVLARLSSRHNRFIRIYYLNRYNTRIIDFRNNKGKSAQNDLFFKFRNSTQF